MEKIEITKDLLITMLHSKPINDFQAGENSSLIKLLKNFIEVEKTIDPVNWIKSALKSAGLNNVIYGMENDRDQYISLLEFFKNYDYNNNNNKLLMVKELKSLLGIGLKEAKEVCDFYASKKIL